MFPSLNTQLSINSPTVVKAQAGRLMRVSVLVAGSAAGGAYDTNDLTRPGLQNQVAVIPATVGIIPIEFHCRQGITLVPGAGQTLAVSYA